MRRNPRPSARGWGSGSKIPAALDNYHTFVQPQMEVNAALQMQGAALNRQAARLQALNNDIAQPQRNPGGMVPTGQGATFMSYSHYFGGAGQGCAVAAAAGRFARRCPAGGGLGLGAVTGGCGAEEAGAGCPVCRGGPVFHRFAAASG